MKNLTNYIQDYTQECVEYINEGLRITKDTEIDTSDGKSYTKTEPSHDLRHKYAKVTTEGKTWKDLGPDFYISIDMIKGKSQDIVNKSIIKIAKEVYPSFIWGEIHYWNDEDDSWQSFACVSNSKKHQMWHPEWTNGLFEGLKITADTEIDTSAGNLNEDVLLTIINIIGPADNKEEAIGVLENCDVDDPEKYISRLVTFIDRMVDSEDYKSLSVHASKDSRSYFNEYDIKDLNGHKIEYDAEPFAEPIHMHIPKVCSLGFYNDGEIHVESNYDKGNISPTYEIVIALK